MDQPKQQNYRQKKLITVDISLQERLSRSVLNKAASEQSDLETVVLKAD